MQNRTITSQLMEIFFFFFLTTDLFLNNYVTEYHDIMLQAREAMACASVDMDIHGADEEPLEADRVELLTRIYQAKMMIQCAKGPMHGLSQKPTAVLGVSN